jgi:hypothetical protein
MSLLIIPFVVAMAAAGTAASREHDKALKNIKEAERGKLR